jgi:hypothetical protein
VTSAGQNLRGIIVPRIEAKREPVRLVYAILNENLVFLPVAVATAVAEDLEGIN